MCNEKDCMCCPGPQGVSGVQGLQGVSGPQGVQGMQGLPGKDCEHRPHHDGDCGDCCDRFMNIYASNSMIVGAYNSSTDTVLFNQKNSVSTGYDTYAIMTPAQATVAGAAADAAVIVTGGTAAQAAAAQAAVIPGLAYYQGASASKAAVLLALGTIAQANAAKAAVLASAPVSDDFDLSLADSTGDLKFLKHGIYHLSWLLQGRITPPTNTPVPSWSFGFWLNGVLVNGSIYSGYTQSPNDDAAHSSGEVQIEINAGDTLRLRNTSASSVSLDPSVNGSVFPITIASINVECLKALA